MPYITPEERAALDEKIDALVIAIQAGPPVARPTAPDWTTPKPEWKPDDTHGLLVYAGRLNYVCTQIALKLVLPYKRYWAHALIAGVFSNIATEFYRRYTVPYEQTKIDANGDLELYRAGKLEGQGAREARRGGGDDGVSGAHRAHVENAVGDAGAAVPHAVAGAADPGKSG